jgi:hypothetical protein
MLVPLLYAQPAFDDRFFFIEELFAFDEASSFGESLMGGEAFLDEEASPDTEISSGEEALLAGELFYEYDDSFFDDDLFYQFPTLTIETPKFQIRSFDAVFPGFSPEQRETAMGSVGLRHSFARGESPMLVPNPDLGINLLGSVMEKDPSHLIEALVVVPYNDQEIDLLEIYNALGRIENIKDYSVMLNNNTPYAITESARIADARNRRDIPDPPPAVTLPFSQTIYLRLKEPNFSNFYLRADVSISLYGITYTITNFADIWYFILPIIRAERFITIIYLEPVEEGILIYCVCGFYLPGFIADRVNLTPNINRRIEIFVNWITDGLRNQENAR